MTNITPERLEQIGSWFEQLESNLAISTNPLHQDRTCARFVIYARQDLIDLLAAYKEQQVKVLGLQKEVCRSDEQIQGQHETISSLSSKFIAQQAEIERLRERLKNTTKLPKEFEEDS